MSENLSRERAALLTHDHARDVSAADLSDRDLEAVVASGKADTPQGRRDLEAGGPMSSLAAFAQMRNEFWSQYGLARRRGPD
jgi:hypothetical protein